MGNTTEAFDICFAACEYVGSIDDVGRLALPCIRFGGKSWRRSLMLLVEQLRMISEMVRKLPEDHWRLQGRERMLTPEEQDARAQATIARLPAVATMAAMKGVRCVAIFRPRMDEIVVPQGDNGCGNDATPGRWDLRGAAIKVFDHCVAQGFETRVHLNPDDEGWHNIFIHW